jgi:ADP-heptose:LPS heptosyltransferase
MDQRCPSPAELGTAKIQRILLVSCTAIGDTLMSTPAFRSMRLAYSHARIDLLIHPAYLTLFHHDPHIDQFIAYDGRWKNFVPLVFRLRQQHYDLIVILHGNEPQATPLAYLSGARWIFKLPNTSRFQFLLTNHSPRLSGQDSAHGIVQRLAVAKLAGGAATNAHLQLTIDSTADKVVMHYLQQQGYQEGLIIGFQVGASTNSRRWAPSRYAELARRLLNAYPDIRILITGSPQERALVEWVAQEIGEARVLLNAGQLALHVLPALIKRCRVLVTPDTGIMHMAIAVETPIIGLFAAADWHGSGPRQHLDQHTVIQKARTCTPCLGKRCTYQQPICMDQITVEEVEEAVKKILVQDKAKRHE